ncbi:hypothetical protein HZF05_13735 [Sphingomonas sp. CGMCC 1.13654]|uniref:Uncharacterized protein n=1 Tax=Sphingomonas chungangi TaxID=2683589 RepID=A0A838LAJ2_9SPHN|nr:hypothetical protein [Sphingomonas chungangi]MBA2935146.1 hypothetical protein [Sphingomonas chungangi]MVW57710.1 hypothetical protein [Sphingomonas chungangi]
MTVKEHIARDLCWLPLLAAFVYVSELARERWLPAFPILVAAVLSVLIANALRIRASRYR